MPLETNLRWPEAIKAQPARFPILVIVHLCRGPDDNRCYIGAVVLGEARVVRVVDGAGRLTAMAHVKDGRLYPDKVFITPEV
jgi:hypothetical protein